MIGGRDLGLRLVDDSTLTAAAHELAEELLPCFCTPAVRHDRTCPAHYRGRVGGALRDAYAVETGEGPPLVQLHRPPRESEAPS